METKTLSKQALDVIDGYVHFSIGRTVSSVPYFNNKTSRSKASFRTFNGKGSPEDIREELETIIIKTKIDPAALTGQSIKKLLVNNNIGIECSGFVYHVLEAESLCRKLGSLKKHISFVNCNGLIGKIRCAIRPLENCDVETFANDKNSLVVSPKEILPGDIITMTKKMDSSERNHILIIREVQYENSLPKLILYSHSIAYPEDGLYGTGVRSGKIEINSLDHPITEAKWTEDNITSDSNPLLARAKRSVTEIRRLNWFW